MSNITRGKYSERINAKTLIEMDGPDNGVLSKLATSTGRVGHLTELQFDIVSKTYAGENKYVSRSAKDPSFRFTRSVIQKLIKASKQFGKEPIWIIHIAGCPVIHAITESRHRQLLQYEKIVHELRNKGVIK